MKNSKLLAFSLLFAGVLSGCVTTDSVLQRNEATSLEAMLAEAQSASKTGRSDQAAIVLRQAAGVFPVDKRPWLELAQLHFNVADYGEAILSAEQVLQRDPADQVAASIIAVSGLRVSSRAIADLSRQNNLSGSLRTEAKELARLLRETLGEPVLIPAHGKPLPGSQRPVITAVPAKRKSIQPREESARSKQGAGSNPFGALK